MEQTHRQFRFSLGRVNYTPRTKELPSSYCSKYLIIPAGQTPSPGQFSLSAREYCKEPLDDFGDWRITDEVLCFGSQLGKTTIIIGGVAYTIGTSPNGVLWVMPNIELARSFSETRWLTILNASPEFARMIKEAGRNAVKLTQQMINGSVVNFIGSNSAANLASRPAPIVIQDEVDKFNEGGSKEADASNLADQRTKAFTPKRVKTSTPTLSTGLIWTEFLKGDQRRYYVPCPSCGKHVLLVWSQQFTIFNKQGCEAYVKWDSEAKRKNGTWDLDRVERSARFECPFCQFAIRDGHKTIMNRNGEWRPTATAPANFRSRHLPSLYAATPETGVGKLAVKFLQAKESLLGLRGFINGDLAEPFESQDLSAMRVEIVGKEEHPVKGVGVLTADFQQNAPHLWWVYQIWGKGITRVMEFGSCDTFEELREIQTRLKVLDKFVCIDSGWQDGIVKENCSRFGERVMTSECRKFNRPPLHIGWTPFLGAKETNFQDKQRRAQFPVRLEKEIFTAFGKEVTMPIYYMNDKGLKDMLAQARKNERKTLRWEVAPELAKNDLFWRHMDSEILMVERVGNRTKEFWDLRSARWPNHGLDCAKAQLGIALYQGLYVDPILSKQLITKA